MNMSGLDPEDVGKLFVGGLNSQSTKDSLQDYFCQFGDVVDSVVMKNNETGRSRGFGFVTFKDPNSLYKVLQVRSHELDGKRIDPKECTPRSLQKGKKQVGKCKLFLGGLPADITEDDIRHGMSRFGKVDQVVIMLDQDTKKCRGFGFLSFELEESIEQACAERFVIINDKQIECKRAEPRARNPAQSPGQQRNQNGSARNSPYGLLGNANQNNWSISPSQPVYNMPGSYGNYQNYGSAAVPMAASPLPGYASVQQMPYSQPYQQNYASAMGSYSYSPVPGNYSQTYVQGSQAPDAAAQEAPAEAAKNYGSNDYSQNATSYGPTKAPFSGGNSADAGGYNNQNANSNVPRYHPYKA